LAPDWSGSAEFGSTIDGIEHAGSVYDDRLVAYFIIYPDMDVRPEAGSSR
jgi:hypothetical protein